MNRRRTTAGIFTFIILAALLLLRPMLQAGSPPAEAAPPVAQRGNDLVIEGQVQPAQAVSLSFQTGGVVAEILVSEGEQVQAGQPLLRLDDAQQQIALQRAQAQLAQAEAVAEAVAGQRVAAAAAVAAAEAEVQSAAAHLALLREGARPEEIAAAESQLAAAQSEVARATAARDALLESVGTDAQVQAARSELANANADLAALEQQYETILDTCFDTPDGKVCPLYGPVEETTRAQLQAAEARVRAAQAGLDRLLAGASEAQERAANAAVSAAIANRNQAQAQLALLQEGATPGQLQQAEVALALAEARVEVAQAQAQEVEAAAQQAQAAIEAAQAGVDAAELALQRTLLAAPFDGSILELRPNLGELVSPEQAVLTIADTSQWQVRTIDLTELDVARVTEGAAVTVELDAFPGERLQGTITAIALFPDTRHGDVTYEATIVLEESELPLRRGMSAVVSGD